MNTRSRSRTRSSNKPQPSEYLSLEEPSTSSSGSNTAIEPETGKNSPEKSPAAEKKNEKVAGDLTEKRARLPPPPPRSILQLKITLYEVTPPIWRRIQVLNTDTFCDLSEHIVGAVGWTAPRWHVFGVFDHAQEKEMRIVDPSGCGNQFVEFDFTDGRHLNGRLIQLSQFLNQEGDTVVFEYDVADCWLHEVEVEKVLPPPKGKADFPKCLGGARACPPEDVGGVDGYKNLVAALKDPLHPQHKDMKDWIKDVEPGWKAERFDNTNVYRA